MVTLLVFILILSVLVLVHEFGHFIVAKRTGVKVEEFGLGIPPRVIGKKIGETIYSFNLLPFGGFVKLLGEDAADEVTTTADPRSFVSKSPWKRAAILVAGVTMNVLLAIVLYYVFFFSTGFKTLNLPLLFDYKFRFGHMQTTNTVVMAYAESSAAKDAGLQIGEAVIEVNNVPVYSVSDVRREIKDKVGQQVRFLVLDLRRQSSKDIRVVDVTPKADTDGSGMIGAYLAKSVILDYNSSTLTKTFAGPLHAYNMLAYSGATFGKLIGISVEQKSMEPVSEGVSGPVGIYSVVGSILSYGGDKVILSLMDLVALMSLSLAFLNIMPFPALDGGRLFFIVIEGLFKKRVNPVIEANIHKWGMIVLIGLIVLITFKDVFRIVN